MAIELPTFVLNMTPYLPLVGNNVKETKKSVVITKINQEFFALRTWR